MVAENTAHLSDDAGAIVVEDEQHVPVGNDFDAKRVHLNDPRIAPAVEGAGDATGFLLGLHMKGDKTGEIAGVATLHFFDLDAALAGNDGGIDIVHSLFEDRREQPLQGGNRQGRHVDAGHLSPVFDRHPFDAAFV